MHYYNHQETATVWVLTVQKYVTIPVPNSSISSSE